MDHIKKKRGKEEKDESNQSKWNDKQKENEKVDFTVAFSRQGETMEENINQMEKIKRALERVKKLIEVDNSEGIPERMERNIKPIQGQEELITGNIQQRDKNKKIQH